MNLFQSANSAGSSVLVIGSELIRRVNWPTRFLVDFLEVIIMVKAQLVAPHLIQGAKGASCVNMVLAALSICRYVSQSYDITERERRESIEPQDFWKSLWSFFGSRVCQPKLWHNIKREAGGSIIGVINGWKSFPRWSTCQLSQPLWRGALIWSYFKSNSPPPDTCHLRSIWDINWTINVRKQCFVFDLHVASLNN